MARVENTSLYFHPNCFVRQRPGGWAGGADKFNPESKELDLPWPHPTLWLVHPIVAGSEWAQAANVPLCTLELSSHIARFDFLCLLPLLLLPLGEFKRVSDRGIDATFLASNHPRRNTKTLAIFSVSFSPPSFLPLRRASVRVYRSQFYSAALAQTLYSFPAFFCLFFSFYFHLVAPS
jgi:hypothetical protein